VNGKKRVNGFVASLSFKAAAAAAAEKNLLRFLISIFFLLIENPIFKE
jgi:small-conductance mechanosensitive channel